MLKPAAHLKAFKALENYPVFLQDDMRLQHRHEYQISMKNGLAFLIRSRSRTRVSDLDIFCEVVLEDEYQLTALIKEDSIIVDIGGHIGLFGCQAARAAKSGKVISFEPVPENFALLQKNAVLNNLTNMQCVNKAVSGDGASIRIYREDWNTGGHSQYGGASEKSCVEAQTVTLKDIMDQYSLDHIDLLKVDCEGGEYEFLLKSDPKDLIKVRAIIMEQHITESIARIYQEDVLINHLTQLGFSVNVQKEIVYPGEGKFFLIHASR